METPRAKIFFPSRLGTGLPQNRGPAANRIGALDPKVRGILGLNFLGRFDLLIDYDHKFICFDDSKSLQHGMQGERVPVIQQEERTGDLAYTMPVLVTVNVQGVGKKGTVLRLDSGCNAATLYENRLATPWWLQRNDARRGSVAGKSGPLVLAKLPSQDVKIGSSTTRQIAFLTPISTDHHMVTMPGEDGLLPTMLFRRVFISYLDHFVMFEPR
jgi:hypothetical protein